MPSPEPRLATVSLVTIATATAGLTLTPPLLPAFTSVVTSRYDLASKVRLPPPLRVTPFSISARTWLVNKVFNPMEAPIPTLPPAPSDVAMTVSISVFSAVRLISPVPALMTEPDLMMA